MRWLLGQFFGFVFFELCSNYYSVYNNYLGRIYRQYYVKNGIHHEVIEKEPGGNLFVLSSSIAGHTEDVVLEIDRKTGETVKNWI